jgi:hypothetical protein
MLLWCELPEDGDYAKTSRSQVGEGIYVDFRNVQLLVLPEF